MKVQQKPTITPLQVNRGSSAGRSSELAPAFGQTANRFFAEGEAHEANHWQDTTLPPDDQPTKRARSGSFDRVPRNRGAMVALALLGTGLGAAVGVGVHALVRGGHPLEAASIDFSRGRGLLPLEASLPLPPALPAVALEAAPSTEATFLPAPAAPHSSATSANGGVNAGPESAPAATAGPAPPETSAAAAVTADRKLRVEEGRQTSRSPKKGTPRPRFALKTAWPRAITPALVEPTPGESSKKSGMPEPNLTAWSDNASDRAATGGLAPPRFEQPSIALTNTGTVAVENTPPIPEKLPAPADDKPAAPAATAGSKHNPF